MATLDLVYEIWFKRRNRKDGESSQTCHGVYEKREDAMQVGLSLDEENVILWKVYRITEIVETLK